MDLDAAQKFCMVKRSEGKGRGVFAARQIPAWTVIEISPVLLFGKEEYEKHGKYTALDHYTFKWPDGSMALPFGIGSLFNHSDSPNVSFSIESATETIRYTTVRTVQQDEELCIFYGHKLWFTPLGSSNNAVAIDSEDVTDAWGGLQAISDSLNPFSDGNQKEMISDHELPFLRTKVIPEDDDEKLEGLFRTIPAWIIDVPDPKLTSTLLRWVKKTGLETRDLEHLRRVRRTDGASSQLLLTAASSPPDLPMDLNLSTPYVVNVPASAALTPESLKLKTSMWPTIYSPKRKWEPDPWSRAKVAWAWDAVQILLAEASRAKEAGELPIVSYVPPPFADDISGQEENEIPSFISIDIRRSSANPLRHSVLNVIRKVADWRASRSSQTKPDEETPTDPVSALSSSDNIGVNGVSTAISDTKSHSSHYLLTSLTLFTTHEPCIMCSMALLHSRLRELIFIRPMDATGGCGGGDGKGTCVPRLKNVNHRYTILRWRAGVDGKLTEDCTDVLGDISEDVDA